MIVFIFYDVMSIFVESTRASTQRTNLLLLIVVDGQLFVKMWFACCLDYFLYTSHNSEDVDIFMCCIGICGNELVYELWLSLVFPNSLKMYR